MLRIAADPYMLRHLPLKECLADVARAGYEAVELSPRSELFPLFGAPVATSRELDEASLVIRRSGVQLDSLWTVYNWSSPDPELRKASVEWMLSFLEGAARLGASEVNTEFSGDPARPDESRRAFLQSMEIVVPRLHDLGLTMSIEPHPNDFVERGSEATALIRELDDDAVRYLFCAPHVYHMQEDVRFMLNDCAEMLHRVHLADSFDHRGSSGIRYILNPPSTSVRVHQHLELGQGEVDFDSIFAGLKQIGFQGTLTASIFAWEEWAVDSLGRTRAAITDLVSRFLSCV